LSQLRDEHAGKPRHLLLGHEKSALQSRRWCARTRRGVATAAATKKPASAHENQVGTPVSPGSPAADADGDALAVGDGVIVTDRVTVDGLGAAITVCAEAVTVWVLVVGVSSRIGDREGFVVADGADVGS